MFKVILKPKAEKNLIKIHPKDGRKVASALKELASDPFTKKLNILKLKGFRNLEKAYRLRVGNIRIIYELYSKKKLIVVYFIDYRKTTTYSFS